MKRDKLEAWMWLPALASMGLGCAGDSGARDSGGQTSISSITASSGTDSSTDSSNSGSDTESDGSATESGSASDTDAASASDDDGDVKFDLGEQPDVDVEMESGCTKVDFLFVIDNSGSMGDDQEALANNFPNFINGIQATLEDVQQYQVGVITTDAYQFNVNGCNELGNLVVQTGGDDSSNMACGPYAEGYNFMTEQDDLATKFACAAKVGSDGSGYERPMNAMEAAVRKDFGGPGQCNEGFIRDDALLVIVIITDEWDGPGDPDGLPSTGDASTWYQTVIDSKMGLAENVVVLSLVHYEPDCMPSNGFLSGDIEPFTLMFGDNGFLGCIADDYGQIFMDATAIIKDACDNFVPPG